MNVRHQAYWSQNLPKNRQQNRHLLLQHPQLNICLLVFKQFPNTPHSFLKIPQNFCKKIPTQNAYARYESAFNYFDMKYCVKSSSSHLDSRRK